MFNYGIIENEHVLSVPELVDLFQKELREKNIDWKVKIKNEALAVHLNYRDKAIYIPHNRQTTYTEAHSIIEHEVGVHLARHINGRLSKLLLLSIGLDHYIVGEEGLANYKQVSIDYSGLPGNVNYLTIGLAIGLHKNKPWNFREIFNFSNEYLEILGAPKQQIHEMSWKRCLRIFRGTTSGSGSGTCFTRDIIYLKGFLQIKKLIETNDPEVSRFLVGKYDPANRNHVDLLNQLDINLTKP